MATVTPNFNWPVPTSTDLVKDGATAIEALGDSIDASLVDLKGGTTGQVLSKTTNTDMDFVWVTTDDANAIQNSIVDAKGDLISATANDTPARLAVGANGTQLMADSSQSTGLRYFSAQAAGKNMIINGDFGVWQRGTTFTNPSFSAYLADRFRNNNYDVAPTTYSVTRETFTPGTALAYGTENGYFFRSTITTKGSNTIYDTCSQRIEGVLNSDAVVTLSFFAKSDSTRTQQAVAGQNFGSGGSAGVTLGGDVFTTTTSWQRFTFTFTVASVSGKTIGTDPYSFMYIRQASASGSVLDIWGVQMEYSPVASEFQTCTGNPASELAACQRYYYRAGGNAAYELLGYAYATNTTVALAGVAVPVSMRVIPTTLEYSTLAFQETGGIFAVSSASFSSPSRQQVAVEVTTAGVLTPGRGGRLLVNNSTSGYIAFSAEL
jgi:hypothetical protein